jgi:hypothetical protein
MNSKMKVLDIYNDNVFKRKIAKEEIVKAKKFIDFIFSIYPQIKQTHEWLEQISWGDYQARLKSNIEKSLFEFEAEARDDGDEIPSSGLKGIYFCLGGDCMTLSIGGSLYFNEADWAGNAKFYLSERNERAIIMDIADKIEQLTTKEIESIIYLFVAFTLLDLLKEVKNIPHLISTGIAMGFSDGDELILGYFKNAEFVLDIQVIKNGVYKNPSSAEELQILRTRKPTGPLWEYIRHNYTDLLRKNGLYLKLDCGGEEEAERIAVEYRQHIFINKCRKCGNIKKTPVATQCLNCMDFSPPKPYYPKPYNILHKILNIFK